MKGLTILNLSATHPGDVNVTFGVFHHRGRSSRGEIIVAVESKLGSCAAAFSIKLGFDLLDSQINIASINDLDRNDAGEFSALDESRYVRIAIGFIERLGSTVNTLHGNKPGVVLDQSGLISYFDSDNNVNIGGFEGCFVNGRVRPADSNTALLNGMRVRDVHRLDDVTELLNCPRRV